MQAHKLSLSSRLVNVERKNRFRVVHIDRYSKIIRHIAVVTERGAGESSGRRSATN